MKIKSYHIASPEQLNELGVFAKDTERLKQIRSVWSIALRKKGKPPGITPYLPSFILTEALERQLLSEYLLITIKSLWQI